MNVHVLRGVVCGVHDLVGDLTSIIHVYKN